MSFDFREEEPILNKSKDAYVQDLLKYAWEHTSEIKFKVIFSQAALATCLRYPSAEGTVEGRVPAKTGVLVEEGVQPMRKWKVAAPQTSKS